MQSITLKLYEDDFKKQYIWDEICAVLNVNSNATEELVLEVCNVTKPEDDVLSEPEE